VRWLALPRCFVCLFVQASQSRSRAPCSWYMCAGWSSCARHCMIMIEIQYQAVICCDPVRSHARAAVETLAARHASRPQSVCLVRAAAARPLRVDCAAPLVFIYDWYYCRNWSMWMCCVVRSRVALCVCSCNLYSRVVAFVVHGVCVQAGAHAHGAA
jgi:hypothetical protein